MTSMRACSRGRRASPGCPGRRGPGGTVVERAGQQAVRDRCVRRRSAPTRRRRRAGSRPRTTSPVRGGSHQHGAVSHALRNGCSTVSRYATRPTMSLHNGTNCIKRLVDQRPGYGQPSGAPPPWAMSSRPPPPPPRRPAPPADQRSRRSGPASRARSLTASTTVGRSAGHADHHHHAPAARRAAAPHVQRQLARCRRRWCRRPPGGRPRRRPADVPRRRWPVPRPCRAAARPQPVQLPLGVVTRRDQRRHPLGQLFPPRLELLGRAGSPARSRWRGTGTRPVPTSASTRRTPEPMDDSPRILTSPSWPDLATCVPPHSSRE